MIRWVTLLVLTACEADDSATDTGTPSSTDTIAGGDADTDADTDGDTDTTPPPTGCYDVPMIVTGGFAAGGQLFTPAPATGATAQLVHGPQGGWHIETAVRVEAVHEAVRVTPVVTIVSSGQVISGAGGDLDLNRATVFLVVDGECSGTYVGLRAFVDDVDPDPLIAESLAGHICGLEGAEVDVRWDVEDITDFRTASATVRATVQMDPIDVAYCASYR